MGIRPSPAALLFVTCALSSCAAFDETGLAVAGARRVVHGHDVKALHGVTRLVGDLVLERATLTDLRGLALEAVTGDVVVRGNPRLRSLEGLDRLASIGGRLVVEKNPRLTSLFELASLREVGGDVTIDGNEALSACEPAALRAQVRRALDDGAAACEGVAVVDAR
jgi:hypothetical protein